MIANKDNETIFITPPKCGTKALEAMAAQLKGFEVFDGDEEWPGGAPHSWSPVPWRFRGYGRVLVVRNPYDRARSLYDHYISWGGEVVPREEFFMNLTSEKRHPFNRPLSEIWRLAQPTGFIKCEGFFPVIRRMNEPSKRTGRLNSTEIDLVDIWAKDDFEIFDY